MTAMNWRLIGINDFIQNNDETYKKPIHIHRTSVQQEKTLMNNKNIGGTRHFH